MPNKYAIEVTRYFNQQFGKTIYELKVDMSWCAPLPIYWPQPLDQIIVKELPIEHHKATHKISISDENVHFLVQKGDLRHTLLMEWTKLLKKYDISDGFIEFILNEAEHQLQAKNYLYSEQSPVPSAMYVEAAVVEYPPSHNFPTDRLSHQLPGMSERTRYPCNCGWEEDVLRKVIIHINDVHANWTTSRDIWDRNRIADWLETLDIDLSFKTQDERVSNE